MARLPAGIDLPPCTRAPAANTHPAPILPPSNPPRRWAQFAETSREKVESSIPSIVSRSPAAQPGYYGCVRRLIFLFATLPALAADFDAVFRIVTDRCQRCHGADGASAG